MGNETSRFDTQKPLQTRDSLVFQPKKNENSWRIGLKHPHLLRTLSGQPEGENYRYFFEYCEITLSSLLQERYDTNKYFPEEDLQALLLGISSALSFLQEAGISHGEDICPREIYFDASSSSFKILDQSLINGRASGIQQALQGKLKYLSPECYQYFGQPLTEEMLYKNDVWCLGMTMLEASLLKTCDSIYQTGLQAQIIEERIQEVSCIYNPTFANILSILLTFNENQRPDPINLFNYLLNLQRVAEFQNQQIPTIIPQPQLKRGLQTLQGSPKKIETNQSRYQKVQQLLQPSLRPITPQKTPTKNETSPKQQIYNNNEGYCTIICQPTIKQTPLQNWNLNIQSPNNQSGLYFQHQRQQSPTNNNTIQKEQTQITPSKIIKRIIYPFENQNRSPSSRITPTKIQQQILNNYDPYRNVNHMTKTQHIQIGPINRNIQNHYYTKGFR